MKRLPVFLFLLLFSLIPVGCDRFSFATTTTTTIPVHTVTFDSLGGTQIAPLVVTEGDLLHAPETPTMTGYTFLGWFQDWKHTLPWDFLVDAVTTDVVLYASWQIQRHTVTFVNDDGDVLKTTTQAYGAPLTAPAMPTRPDYVFVGWFLGDEEEMPYEAMTTPAEDVTLHARYDVVGYELPIVLITLDRPIMDVTREEYVDATIAIVNTADPYLLADSHALFRGRGNGSWWSYEKRGYRIKFDAEQGLFGETASRHWVLVPGAHDFSSMRANVAFTIVDDVLDGIEYTTSVHIVEVYVNGAYYGVYSLFEQVRVDTGRVDIDSEYGILDTGYLIEYDSYAGGTDGIDYFRVDGLRYAFSMRSPEPDEYMEEVTEDVYRDQVAFLRDYVQGFVDAVFDHDLEAVARTADLDSLVDMYIIHELFKNTDTGWSSFFLYKKPGGKLYCGPAWDFDFTAGISRGDASVEGLYVGDAARWLTDFTSSEIYLELMATDAFVALVQERYVAVADAIAASIEASFTAAAVYGESFTRDALRWSWLYNWRNDQDFVHDWLVARNDWLRAWAEAGIAHRT